MLHVLLFEPAPTAPQMELRRSCAAARAALTKHVSLASYSSVEVVLPWPSLDAMSRCRQRALGGHTHVPRPRGSPMGSAAYWKIRTSNPSAWWANSESLLESYSPVSQVACKQASRPHAHPAPTRARCAVSQGPSHHQIRGLEGLSRGPPSSENHQRHTISMGNLQPNMRWEQWNYYYVRILFSI